MYRYNIYTSKKSALTLPRDKKTKTLKTTLKKITSNRVIHNISIQKALKSHNSSSEIFVTQHDVGTTHITLPPHRLAETNASRTQFIQMFLFQTPNVLLSKQHRNRMRTKAGESGEANRTISHHQKTNTGLRSSAFRFEKPVKLTAKHVLYW